MNDEANTFFLFACFAWRLPHAGGWTLPPPGFVPIVSLDIYPESLQGSEGFTLHPVLVMNVTLEVALEGAACTEGQQSAALPVQT